MNADKVAVDNKEEDDDDDEYDEKNKLVIAPPIIADDGPVDPNAPGNYFKTFKSQANLRENISYKLSLHINTQS